MSFDIVTFLPPILVLLFERCEWRGEREDVSDKNEGYFERNSRDVEKVEMIQNININGLINWYIFGICLFEIKFYVCSD